jgi:hypothetical protein
MPCMETTPDVPPARELQANGLQNEVLAINALAYTRFAPINDAYAA